MLDVEDVIGLFMERAPSEGVRSQWEPGGCLWYLTMPWWMTAQQWEAWSATDTGTYPVAPGVYL